jgi:hypothetical protein
VGHADGAARRRTVACLAKPRRVIDRRILHTVRMQLDGEQLEDFIKSYENAFDERITAEQANEIHARLLDLYARIKKVHDEDSA